MTQTLAAPVQIAGRAPEFSDTVRSEWTKMRTLRSTPITLAVTAFIGIGLSALITLAVVSNPAHAGADASDHPLRIIQAGWGLCLLAFEVLGVLVVTNEYSSGMISETLLATPRRLRVLMAKVLVFVAPGLRGGRGHELHQLLRRARRHLRLPPVPQCRP